MQPATTTHRAFQTLASLVGRLVVVVVAIALVRAVRRLRTVARVDRFRCVCVYTHVRDRSLSLEFGDYKKCVERRRYRHDVKPIRACAKLTKHTH
jgi:hypothetical protein